MRTPCARGCRRGSPETQGGESRSRPAPGGSWAGSAPAWSGSSGTGAGSRSTPTTSSSATPSPSSSEPASSTSCCSTRSSRTCGTARLRRSRAGVARRTSAALTQLELRVDRDAKASRIACYASQLGHLALDGRRPDDPAALAGGRAVRPAHDPGGGAMTGRELSARVRPVVKRVIPARARRALRTYVRPVWPPVGLARFGSLRRLTPAGDGSSGSAASRSTATTSSVSCVSRRARTTTSRATCAGGSWRSATPTTR